MTVPLSERLGDPSHSAGNDQIRIKMKDQILISGWCRKSAALDTAGCARLKIEHIPKQGWLYQL